MIYPLFFLFSCTSILSLQAAPNADDGRSEVTDAQRAAHPPSIALTPLTNAEVEALAEFLGPVKAAFDSVTRSLPTHRESVHALDPTFKLWTRELGKAGINCNKEDVPKAQTFLEQLLQKTLEELANKNAMKEGEAKLQQAIEEGKQNLDEIIKEGEEKREQAIAKTPKNVKKALATTAYYLNPSQNNRQNIRKYNQERELSVVTKGDEQLGQMLILYAKVLSHSPTEILEQAKEKLQNEIFASYTADNPKEITFCQGGVRNRWLTCVLPTLIASTAKPQTTEIKSKVQQESESQAIAAELEQKTSQREGDAVQMQQAIAASWKTAKEDELSHLKQESAESWLVEQERKVAEIARKGQ